MTRRSRRRLLRAGLSGVAFALAGCTSLGLGSDDTPSETAQEDRSPATTADRPSTETDTAGRQQRPTHRTTAEQPSTETTEERSTDSTRTATTSTPAMTPSTPVGTSNAGADIGVHNGDDTRRTVTIVVELDDESPIFDRETTVPAGESMKWDLPLETAGTYRITARLDGGASATYEWELDDPSAAAARVVYIAVEDGEITFSSMYV